MRAWALAALDLVFPAFCPTCAEPLGAGRRDPLCGACWCAIPRLAPPLCLRCGIPLGLEQAGQGAACLGCRVDPPAFDRAQGAGTYTGPLRQALHALKFRGQRALARPLAELIREQCGSLLLPEVEGLVPVPLARER